MSETLPLLIDRVDTPIGEMLIVADREANLRSVGWADHEDATLTDRDRKSLTILHRLLAGEFKNGIDPVSGVWG
jgi:hypothetical protein